MNIQETLDFIKSNGIEMVNFMYPAADGRLKTLNFTVNDDDYLLSILRYGERVDGSSLFPFIEAGNSDLYVIPRLGTMFLDPFASRPTACFLCAFLDKNGRRLDCSPEYTLVKARDAFRRRTGMDFHAMGELEFYVSAPEDEALAMYPATDQKAEGRSSTDIPKSAISGSTAGSTSRTRSSSFPWTLRTPPTSSCWRSG